MKPTSRKEKSGRTPNDWQKGRVVPISIKDVLEKRESVNKDSEEMRELTIRTDPTDENSLRIKRRIKVLDNPTRVLDVLKAREAIKEGLVGNHITQGPNQYRYTRSFLAGEALRVFNEKARSRS